MTRDISVKRHRKHPLDFPGSQAAQYDPGPFDPLTIVEVVDEVDAPATGEDVLVGSIHQEGFFWVSSSDLVPIGPTAHALLKRAR